jgi:membrane associated rhomboid family serine protease
MIPLHDKDRSHSMPLAISGIMLLNSVLFLVLAMYSTPQRAALISYFGVVPARIAHPDTILLITRLSADSYALVASMFLHGSVGHLVCNLWALWLFGKNVEDRMGHLRFALFYVACGALATLTQILLAPQSNMATIGSSGAIAGVLGAYMMLFPRGRILAMFPLFFWPILFSVPAVLYMVVWFGVEVIAGSATVLSSDFVRVSAIDWWAHLGGFLSGVVLVSTFAPPARHHLRSAVAQ